MILVVFYAPFSDLINNYKKNLPIRPAVMARFLIFGGIGYLNSSLAVKAVAECAKTRNKYPFAVPMFLTEKKYIQ